MYSTVALLRRLLVPGFAASAIACVGASSPKSMGTGLTGTPDADAWLSLPSEPIPDAQTVETRDGWWVVPDRIALFLNEGATVGEVNSLLLAVEGTILGADPELGRLVISIGEGRDLDADVALAGGAAGVTNATWSVVTPPQSLPLAHTVSELSGADSWEWYTEAEGASWGLKHVRAPQVWNLRAALAANADRVPAVVVADSPFGLHQDGMLVSDFWDRGDLSTDEEAAFHGTASLGLVSTAWDGVGIESVFPSEPGGTELRVDAIRFDPGVHTSDQALERFGERLFSGSLNEQNLLLNYSHGVYPVNCTGSGGALSCTQAMEAESLTIPDALGTDWAEWAARVDEHYTSHWLMTCSAGNTYVSAADAADPQYSGLSEAAYSARINSGCANAANRGLSDHFVAVEALSRGGAPWDDIGPSGSARGGTIAAPGDDLGVLVGAFDGYATGGGTSFAAPMTASALAVLWTLAPEADSTELRAALLAGAAESVSGSAPQLDVWGATEALDEALGLDLSLWLADVDDGTVDGNRRLDLDSGADVVGGTPSGDGCVDMRDLRSFRDHLWDVVGAPYTRLDGSASHPLRDGNLDGQVFFTELATGPTAEAQWSRYDLDGDGDVSDLDLRVLEQAWLRCRAGVTATAVDEGVDIYEVESRLRSTDLWIPIDEPTRIIVPGVESSWAIPSGTPERLQDGRWLVTVPLDACSPTEVRVGEEVWIADDLPYAEDVRWDLDTRTGPPLRTPLSYHRSGGSLAELALHTSIGDSYTSLSSLSYLTLAAPTGDRVAGSAVGSLEIVGLSDTLLSVDISGLGEEELEPWAWNPDGTGLIGRSLESDAMVYVDVLAEVGWVPGSGVTRRGELTVGADGYFWFVGTDNWLYRQLVRPPAPDAEPEIWLEWSGAVTEPACSDGAAEAPVAMWELDAFGADVEPVSAVPSPISADGRLMLVKASRGGGTFDLGVVDLETGDSAVLVGDWYPRWMDEMVWEPFPADGVAWAPSADGVLYVAEDGVHRLIWTDDGAPSSVSASLVSTHTGPIAVSPTGARFIVMTYTGPISAYEGEVWIVAIDGSSESGPLLNRVERGLPTWSGDGQYVAYAEGTASVAEIVVVDPSASEVFDTRGWEHEGRTTVERYPTWGVDLRGW